MKNNVISLENHIKKMYFKAYPLEKKTKEIREGLKKIKNMPKKLIKKVNIFLNELKEQKEQKNNVKIISWAWEFTYLLLDDFHPRHAVYMHYIVNQKLKKIGFFLTDKELKEHFKEKNNE